MLKNAKAHDFPNQNNKSSSVLQIKQDDKFFCRLLSKESSMSNPSFRVGSGCGSAAIPFVWESQPGTPKYTFSEETLPPLTPPPSYHFKNNKKRPAKARSMNSRSNNIFMALLPKLNLKRIIQSPSLSSSSSSSSEFNDSSGVVPMGRVGRRRRFLSYGSSFDFRGNEDEDHGGSASPNSSPSLCFGISRTASSNNGFQSSFRRRA